MLIDKYVNILKERVRIDRNIRNNETTNDYEKWCESECVAIEMVLERLEEMTALAIHYEQELNKLTKELEKYKKVGG